MLPRSLLWPLAADDDPAAAALLLPPDVRGLMRSARYTLRLVERSTRDAADARARSVALGALDAHEFAEAVASRRGRFPELREIRFNSIKSTDTMCYVLAALAALPAPERITSLALSGRGAADKAMAEALASRVAALPALARFQLQGLDVPVRGLGRLLRCLSGAPALASLDLGGVRSTATNNELLDALSSGGRRLAEAAGARACAF